MSLFDRVALIGKARDALADVEALLCPGDAFDYEEVAIFSSVINGAQEHLVFVPLTQASASFRTQMTLGSATSWEDVDTLPLYGLYMMSPTDCMVEGMFVTWVRRSEPAKVYFTFRGNYEIHLETCWTSSSNQV